MTTQVLSRPTCETTIKPHQIIRWSKPSRAAIAECHRDFAQLLHAVSPGWIAGGIIRDYFANQDSDTDCDVFFPSMEALEEGRRSIEAANAWKLGENADVAEWMLGSVKVQFVKRYFCESLEETLARFDFTVCSCGIDQSGRVIVHPQFFEDLAFRRLMLNSIHTPVGTLGRLTKYMAKGYTPDKATLLALAIKLKDVDFDDPRQNKLQWYGRGTQRKGRFQVNEFCGEDEAA